MSFVLLCNEAGILYINDVPILLVEELEGCLEWTLNRTAEQSLWIDYISR
jgi:hypothetical protein